MVSDISNTRYAYRARRLVDLAENLRALGANELLSIPQIVVIGGQSAGKSSLVEAVSGIRVPRDSGTCTRCPMECNLKRDPGQWMCKITLRMEYNAENIPLSNTQLVPFGPVLTNPGDVELALRRAQAALLCPNESSDSFLNMTEERLRWYRTEEAFTTGGVLKFTRNAVCVEIKDPDVVNLTFVDLPGLIQNEEPSIVQLVEGLVKSNIERNSQLILVTIPMSDDMENQRAKRIAAEVDAAGVRTIGVLTKPDTLTSGAISARERWKNILFGTNPAASTASSGTTRVIPSHALKHGYFCVKLSDDAERAADLAADVPLTRAERQEREMAFFSGTEPWSGIMRRDRFGVMNLVTDLSKHLTKLLDDSLPEMRSRVEALLKECREALERLPKPPAVDATVEVLHRTTEFCRELSATVHGNGLGFGQFTDLQNGDAGVLGSGANGAAANYKLMGSKAFIRKNREAYDEFMRLIRATAPDFRPFEGYQKYTRPYHDLLEDGNASAEADDENPKDLNDVRQVIKESITWELPHNVPFDAKRSLIMDFTSQWDEPARNCFGSVTRLLERTLKEGVARHFGRYHKLKVHVEELVMEQLALQKMAAMGALERALELEKNPFFTLNTAYFNHVRQLWMIEYRDVRRNQERHRKLARPIVALEGCERMRCLSPPMLLPELSVPPDMQETTLGRALRALRDLGYPSLTSEDLKRLYPPDAFEEEIIVMADVRAYFQVAYKRVADYIPLTIEHALNQALCGELQVFLLQKLDVGSADASQRLSALLTDDPAIVEEREALTARLRKLEKIQQELRSFDA